MMRDGKLLGSEISTAVISLIGIGRGVRFDGVIFREFMYIADLGWVLYI